MIIPFLGHIQLRFVPKMELINTDPYSIMHFMGSGSVKQPWLVILIIKHKSYAYTKLIRMSKPKFKMVLGLSVSLLLTP